MGASIRKEMTARVTHLIANTVQGEKYRVSKFLLYYIMSSSLGVDKSYSRILV